MVDGAIRVKARIDLTSAKKDIKDFEKEIAKAEKDIESLERKKAKDTAEYEDDANTPGAKQDEAIEKQQQIVEAIEKQQAELQAKIDNYKQKLEEARQVFQDANALNNAGAELNTEESATAFLSKIQTQEQYNAALENTKARMEEIEELARRIADEKGVDVNSLLEANGEYTKLANRLKVLVEHQDEFKASAITSFDGARKAADKMASSVKSGIKKMARYSLAIFGIREAYSAVRQVVNT